MCVRVSTRGGWGGQSDAFDGEYEIRQGGGEEIIVSPTVHYPYHHTHESDTFFSPHISSISIARCEPVSSSERKRDQNHGILNTDLNDRSVYLLISFPYVSYPIIFHLHLHLRHRSRIQIRTLNTTRVPGQIATTHRIALHRGATRHDTIRHDQDRTAYGSRPLLYVL
jgi:hypothetical protein